MKDKINVAFIGAGWQSAFRHIPAYAKLKNVRLLGIIDPDAKKAKTVAKKYDMLYTTEENIDLIPWFAEVDAVSIATPPATHYEWIKKCLNAGKHVLTEKPFSLQRKHGEELLMLSKEKKCLLCVVHNTLFMSAQQQARTLIKKGKIGEITGLSITLKNNPNRHLPSWYDTLPCGLLYDEISHFLYTSKSIIPDLSVKDAECYLSRNGLTNTPSKARITLMSENFPVFYFLDFESPVCEWHIAIQGTKGILNIDEFRDILIFIPNDKTHKAIDHLRTIYCLIKDTVLGFAKTGWKQIRGKLFYGMDEVIRHFITAIAEKTPPHLYISGEYGIAVFDLLCDTIDQLEKGKDNTPFNLKLEKPKMGTQ